MSSKNLTPSLDHSSKSRVRKVGYQTTAAKWNMAMYRKLGVALRKDPEADLIDLLSSTYSKQLRSYKSRTPSQQIPETIGNKDLRSRLATTNPCTVIYELSAEVQDLLRSSNLSEALIKLLHQSDILYGTNCATSMVLKISTTIAVKITHAEAITEYHSLSHLQEHLPTFPAPRPHGLLRFCGFNFLFMTFVPGIDLEKAWPQLDETQKAAISSQLDALFSELRSLPLSDGAPLGDIQGKGCKDIRRDIRINSNPIWDEETFRDFIFTGSKMASPVYIRLLRDLMPTSSTKCVFTHGDLRPANVIVNMGHDKTCKVAAVIDWEASGFYPEYWESVKMTNNLTPRDRNDWYMYLPASLSLRQYPIQWLVDRVWDQIMVNS
ncbi:kinase-like domain-containing protein [Dactylonectria estremocensis]|uniref:Kinase-like domain-containing protein n=1 Tax=Dactylonectria estremocensis TaxID=1079267 RepID=A0A9P9DJ41_9HYPO|nr:kinase-like domain-containing protein [Dactylonectria estremocensis]